MTAGDGQGRPRRITALVPEPQGAGSIRIEVDGARFGSVAPEVVHAEHLRTRAEDLYARQLPQVVDFT